MKYHIGQTPASPKREPDASLMEYPWPASRLTSDDMYKLHILRLQTRKPITVLLHEAVQAYCNAVNEESNGQARRH